MKFSHKIVAASSVLLLATVALLSGSQYFKVRDEIRSMVSDSVDEIVDGVSKTTAEVINGRKSIAQYATSLIENNPEPDNVRTIISQPLIKNTFLLVGFGLEKDGSNINNDPSWNRQRRNSGFRRNASQRQCNRSIPRFHLLRCQLG